MASVRQLVTFAVSDERFALDAGAVDRVVRAVQVDRLPGAPDVVLGVIDVQGAVVPVLSARRLFGLPFRPVSASDHLILTACGGREVAVLVDAVDEVVEVAVDQVVPHGPDVPGTDRLEGVAVMADGLLFVQDVGAALTADEAAWLARALEVASGDG